MEPASRDSRDEKKSRGQGVREPGSQGVKRMTRKKGMVWCESGGAVEGPMRYFAREYQSIGQPANDLVSGGCHHRSLFIIRRLSIETNVRTPSFCVFSVYSLLFAGEVLLEVVESWDKKWAPSPRNDELSPLLHLHRFVFTFVCFRWVVVVDEPCPEGKKQAVTTLQGCGSMGMSHKRKNKILDRVPLSLWMNRHRLIQSTFTHSLWLLSSLHVSCCALVQYLYLYLDPLLVILIHCCYAFASLLFCLFTLLIVDLLSLLSHEVSPPAWPFPLFCFVFAHLPLLFLPNSTYSCLCSCHHFHAPLSFFLISPCSSFSFSNQPANKSSKCKHWRKRRLRLNIMSHFQQAG